MRGYDLLEPADAADFLQRHQVDVSRMTAPYLVIRDTGGRLVMLFKKTDGQLLVIDVTGAPVPQDFYASTDVTTVGKILQWMDPSGDAQRLMLDFEQSGSGRALTNLGDLVQNLLTGLSSLAANLAAIALILGGWWIWNQSQAARR